MGEWLEFDIHGRVALRVASNAPTASLLADMFAPFATKGLNHFDLTITGEVESVPGGAFGEAHGETEFQYTDKALYLEASGVQVILDENGFHLNGQSELLVMALPLIDRIAVTKGAAMIHALTVAYRGHGLNMPAWGGTGKTSTMVKLLKIDGFSFMGDDWAFLSEQSDLLGYAKPMSIKPYHRTLYPHLFEKRHKPLVPMALSKQIHSLTTRVHPFVTRYPRFARFTRRWSPEHMMVTPQQAFPQAAFSTAAPLVASIFVERFEGEPTDVQFTEKDKCWMVSRLIGNFNSEMTKHSRVVMTTLGAAGIVPIEKAFSDKAAVLDRALADKPSFLLRVPKVLTPDQASDIIVAHIQKVLVLAGVP